VARKQVEEELACIKEEVATKDDQIDGSYPLTYGRINM